MFPPPIVCSKDKLFTFKRGLEGFGLVPLLVVLSADVDL